MRRFLVAVVGVALAFSATGCGRTGLSSGAASTASNRAEAVSDAQHLLAMVRVPAGSNLASAPYGAGLDQSRGFIGVSASATASRTWIVHDSVDQTLRYVVAHLRHGSKIQSTGSGNGEEELQIRSWPPVKGVLNGRWLALQAYSSAGHTYLTARAQSQWVITRDSNERIPSNVSKIEITVTNGNGRKAHQLTITKHRTVRDVVRLYNSLGVIQPATILGCPPEITGSLTVRFYKPPADEVATAISPNDGNPSWPASAAVWACFPIKITLAQHRAPSLSGNVITPLARLLHTRLSP
ncbi:MAG: lipoprotein [Solirubrobacteraceae bacterium]